jgi:hypothetical protein
VLKYDVELSCLWLRHGGLRKQLIPVGPPCGAGALPRHTSRPALRLQLLHCLFSLSAQLLVCCSPFTLALHILTLTDLHDLSLEALHFSTAVVHARPTVSAVSQSRTKIDTSNRKPSLFQQRPRELVIRAPREGETVQ